MDDTAKRKPGRPRKGPKKVRAYSRPKTIQASVWLKIRLSKEESDRVRYHAKAANKTVSAFVREWIGSL